MPKTKTRTRTKTKTRTRLGRVFGRKDTLSNDGMLTTVWGPGMWHFLHTMSFNYPVHPTPQDRARYQRFLLSLQYILPCGKCRENLRKTMRTTLPLRPCHLVSRESLSRYVYILHETVNRLLGKQSGLSYADVRERYEHFRARCLSDKNEEKEQKEHKGTEVGCVEPVYGTKAKCV